MILEFKPKKRPSVGSKKCKPYFNQDCYLRRKEYRKCRNLHWRLQRAETKENLIVSRREHKRTLNRQLRERPFNLKGGGGLWVFLKKYSDSQCC